MLAANSVVVANHICAILACAVCVFATPPKRAIYLELPKPVGKYIMINDHISDMITRIHNAYMVHKKTVTMPHTKVVKAIAQVMLEEKYLTKVEEVVETGQHKVLKLTLSYKNDAPAISSIKRVSKPGVRIYRPLHNFKPVLSGLGISILSTSKGILSDRSAKLNKVGGEVLAELW